MVPWRATDDGFVTPHVLAWYERFAEGQPGVLVVEATGIRDVPSGPLLRIGHDRYLPGLRQLVETVRKASEGRTRLFIQIIDFLSIRRRPTKENFFGRFLQIDGALRERMGGTDDAEIRARLLRSSEAELETLLDERQLEAYRYGARERVTDAHLKDLPTTLPDLFSNAAARAQQAGFDGVELHYAHAYTMASFLSARNTRTDGYGGTREGRVRLPLEVYRAVRERIGHRIALGCRFLSDEVIPGGTRGDDAAYFGVELARAGMDFLSLSKGGKFEDAKQPKVGAAAYPYTGPSGHECMPTTSMGPPGPFGRNAPLAAQVRDAVRKAGFSTPVVYAGGIASFWQAEELLRSGSADIIGAARQTLADPDWFKKMRLGEGEKIRRCLFTNYCEGLDQTHKAVTCQRWDRGVFPDDATAERTSDGRRLLPPSSEPEKSGEQRFVIGPSDDHDR
ncbi:MAG: oxidoreductase [Myxococcaceae bacterium]